MTEPNGSFRAASAVGTLRMMSKTGAKAELAIVAPHRGGLHCLSTRRNSQPLAPHALRSQPTISATGSIICTAGFPSAAIASNCFTRLVALQFGMVSKESSTFTCFRMRNPVLKQHTPRRVPQICIVASTTPPCQRRQDNTRPKQSACCEHPRARRAKQLASPKTRMNLLSAWSTAPLVLYSMTPMITVSQREASQ
jgi:hypothetical protein